MPSKLSLVRWCQRHLVNPGARRLPGLVILETTGRRSGLPRRTPVGGKREGDTFWLVSEHGRHSDYVRNIEAAPRVRVRLRGTWHEATAHPMPDDDPRARLRRLGGLNSAGVRAMGTDLLTIRLELDR